MMKRKVYFSLGSNLGDRETNIRKALKMMENRFSEADGTAVTGEISSMYETEPCGFESENKFINCAAMYETSLECRRILDICKEIEKELGRNIKGEEYGSDGKRIYRSRTIDIDILLFGDETINEADLKIPHERMYEREFVMIPLKEIMQNESK